MILLDTNVLLWFQEGHRRVRHLVASSEPFAISPLTLLELSFLYETGRFSDWTPKKIDSFLDDPRWVVDDPPSLAWFNTARDITWTRDPFDRLIVAHARYRRWRFATSDARIIERLGSRDVIEV